MGIWIGIQIIVFTFSDAKLEKKNNLGVHKRLLVQSTNCPASTNVIFMTYWQRINNVKYIKYKKPRNILN